MIVTFLLSLVIPGEWVWEDQSYRINMGIDFQSGNVVFTDLDADGDEDMVRYWVDNLLDPHLEAFENITCDAGDGLWKPNQALIEGIADSGIRSLGGM